MLSRITWTADARSRRRNRLPPDVSRRGGPMNHPGPEGHVDRGCRYPPTSYGPQQYVPMLPGRAWARPEQYRARGWLLIVRARAFGVASRRVASTARAWPTGHHR